MKKGSHPYLLRHTLEVAEGEIQENGGGVDRTTWKFLIFSSTERELKKNINVSVGNTIGKGLVHAEDGLVH